MYLFYVDESGNRDIEHLDTERFYVLTAVGMCELHWKHFYFDLTTQKYNIMKRIWDAYGVELDLATDTEVKSTLLRNAKARQKHPFSLYQTEDERLTLVNEFYSQLAKCKAVVVSAVIDKKNITSELHLSNQQELHNKAWELLCEQIESYMKECHPKHKAILVTDDTDKQKNLQTTRAHAHLYRTGASSGVKLSHIIEMPMFVSSATCVGVQLADLCCYNVYRRFKDNNPQYEFFTKIEPFFYNSKNTSHTQKDGLKVFPDESEVLKKMKFGWDNPYRATCSTELVII